jgi:hypothetical protein
MLDSFQPGRRLSPFNAVEVDYKVAGSRAFEISYTDHRHADRISFLGSIHAG